jgi:hypothetical protein
MNYSTSTAPTTLPLPPGAVGAIIFTSLLHVYDFFVRKEFHQKKAIIEAKRQFVRFISTWRTSERNFHGITTAA